MQGQRSQVRAAGAAQQARCGKLTACGGGREGGGEGGGGGGGGNGTELRRLGVTTHGGNDVCGVEQLQQQPRVANKVDLRHDYEV
jgi:hypothetical protein